MVRNSENGWVSGTRSENVIGGLEGGRAIPALGNLIEGIEASAGIGWVRDSEGGRYPGLSDAVEPAIAACIVRCGADCRMRAMIGDVEEARVLEGSSLVLQCADVVHPEMIDALAEESTCMENQALTSSHFPDWVESTGAEIS